VASNSVERSPEAILITLSSKAQGEVNIHCLKICGKGYFSAGCSEFTYTFCLFVAANIESRFPTPRVALLSKPQLHPSPQTGSFNNSTPAFSPVGQMTRRTGSD